ncbi:aldehyde dehydrogenase family protein [Sphingobium sp. JS3065]|uniref:aldehyde dehydrogenase family protein n=1 Tax=Sphingobium sp. JS3065 TaxID=2970925 RepID=UPI0022641F2D|nr:aldehyde dehydrogenase family protein [Sphingobium sp. JS3065]UZW56004.1 aldehyde dehydrogenase family protein [Sphingobium sp. JS3065]
MAPSSEFPMLIDGSLVAGAASMPVVNPATGQVFTEAPDASAEQLDLVITAAKRAFPAWSERPIAERQGLLIKAAEAITAHTDELTALLTREQGKPLAAATAEIQASLGWFHYFAQMTPPVLVSEDSETRRVETRYVPLGVVCAISPWNFPVMLSCWKIVPALLAGNTVVLKPSPFTPLTMLRIGALLKDVFPAGVLNIITGGDTLGPKMTAHPGFAKISFTGSTATGKLVMQSASETMKRITLELGGNDAAIIMPDIDLDAVALKIFMGAFYNSAQVCTATKRLYVHEAIYDALRDRFVALAQAMKLGDGAEEGTVFGPIQNERQYRRVKALIEEARQQGLTIIEGPQGPQGGGYFVPITIVDNPPDDARVVTEEAFGPVLPLLKFSNVDDAIRRANASEFGLAGAVWSRDVHKAVEIASRLETGTVWINENLYLPPTAPFAGHKQSGLGVENGMDGLLQYMDPKTIYIPKAA